MTGLRSCWEAQYKDAEGHLVTLNDTATVECPTSINVDEVNDLVQLYAKGEVFRKFGASPLGPDLRDWPARVVDAFVVMDNESKRVDELVRRSRGGQTHQQQSPRGTKR